ncbi:putative E3 ubiquitin-protein ligase UBR7 [Saccostrea echinata]|uniref:putative E3 ubiquitin-protein ligase UBR7 n=1 Tax=Saccostrea echinata TaxID=191078 RepID=UPI002A82DDE3|nr:putative E3 ubiquitin-protein ligase UBR7 [Saccostrea echinata]
MDESLAPVEKSSEDVLSMVDVLKEEVELEEEANAVLGDSDDQNCTYPLGYVSRQALYACATCAPESPAGVCLACSLECHEGHELFELYSKRNFRCDCGNSKFPGTKCKLYSEKDATNSENAYNQNFKGLYCTCHRPYPDPEDEIEDEMIQCVICEDWYHGRHLGLDSLPSSESYTEVVCADCMKKHDFLWAYSVQSLDTQCLVTEDTSAEANVEETSPNKQENKADNSCHQGTSESTQNDIYCLLKDIQKRDVTFKDCGTFWQDGWRKKLCKCADCLVMYKEKGLEFLTDESDTVHNYEQRGRDKAVSSSQYDKGLQALSSMNRVQQVEVLHGFNDLKSELTDYLKKFAENGKVVREEDIREFFSGMEARKRQRAAGPIPYMCK